MTTRLVAVLAALVLSGCTHDDPRPAAVTTLTVTVAGADTTRTQYVARVLDARLRALGAPSAHDDASAGHVTFHLPRRLTDDEVTALSATGHLVFRPVLEQRPPDCSGLPNAADRDEALACDAEGTATYRLGPAELSDVDVEKATAEAVPGSGEWAVRLELKSARRFADLTEKFTGHQLAIVLDGVVQSAPTVNEPIPDGTATISGSFTQARAQHLAAVLAGGPLPARVTVSQD